MTAKQFDLYMQKRMKIISDKFQLNDIENAVDLIVAWANKYHGYDYESKWFKTIIKETVQTL